MAIKRALVVDDSRSARIALKKLLEVHDLDVALAESGEDALEYLKKQDADVIFMDHTMPGMDGLEAVSAIKANPRTATVPVMMYTTKGGEVYVGQARALGAMGVLPKNVQPHQLFEMLLKLGLVQDRRAASTEATVAPAEEGESATTPVQTESSQIPTWEGYPEDRRQAPLDSVDAQLDQQAMGMSVQALVSRILEDQHLTLRSDILRTQKDFARDVAREVLVEQSRIQGEDEDASDHEEVLYEQSQPPASSANWWLRAAGFAVVCACLFMTWQFKDQRDQALQIAKQVRSEASDSAQQMDLVLQQTLNSVTGEYSGLQTNALGALEWSINLGNESWVHEAAFSDELAQKVTSLVAYLQKMQFAGEVRLISHLGQFCLVTDTSGAYNLAPDTLPALECDYTGHPLEGSSYVSDRLSVEFSRLMRGPLSEEIELNLVALDEVASQDLVAYPGTTATAGEWNAVALQNNRVQVDLIPAS